PAAEPEPTAVERARPERVRPERVRDDSFPMRAWGLPGDGELDRVVVVSPHLDDAVLGCARFLAVHPGATVVTVFAGNPDAYPEPMRLWDVQSGFGPGDDVMEARRREDRAALARLDATPMHLDFVEHTYNAGDRPVDPATIADRLGTVLDALEPTLVLAPFGLANPDHDVTHRACMLARDRLAPPRSWWCYEDNGYKHIPGLLAWRVSSLFRRGVWPTPVCPPVDADETRKQAAIACYPSQLLALEDDWAISAKLAAPAPEQFWRLAPPPPGWERLTDD
ncbi:MAG TPA: PIG-L family deacetylase, partial [Acidimicrobiia bacterium]